MSFFAGLDLGQAADYTALGIVERIAPEMEPSAAEWRNGVRVKHGPAVYHLRHLERPKLGTPYPAIVTQVKERMGALRGHGVTLAIDFTGVGRAVGDMMQQAGLRFEAVTITGGDRATYEKGTYYVPKRDLVGVLQVLFQNKRLLVAEGLELAPVFVRELMDFRVKINAKTAHDSYEAWREGAHDDLVLAVAIACWYAEYHSGPRYRSKPRASLRRG